MSLTGRALRQQVPNQVWQNHFSHRMVRYSISTASLEKISANFLFTLMKSKYYCSHLHITWSRRCNQLKTMMKYGWARCLHLLPFRKELFYGWMTNQPIISNRSTKCTPMQILKYYSWLARKWQKSGWNYLAGCLYGPESDSKSFLIWSGKRRRAPTTTLVSTCFNYSIIGTDTRRLYWSTVEQFKKVSKTQRIGKWRSRLFTK